MQRQFVSRRAFARACAAAGALPYAALAQPARNPAIVKAMDSIRAAIPTAAADSERPVWHFHPPANWNNDPNGTIFYKGWHHLFYQCNPYGAEWGHMHWGHARSRDLVNWEHLPIALWPSLEKGEEHVFSGAAMPGPDGRPRLFYTSIGKRDPEQWMASPLDDGLIAWEKYPGNPVLTLKAHGARAVAEWRDPFLFRENGRVYMVCGGHWAEGPPSGGAAVQLYVAENPEMTRWKHLGPLFEWRDRRIVNIECPNFFKVGAKWVLLTSPEKPCEYFTGEMDWSRNRFLPEAHGVLDPGASYASNISVDDKGRTILWLWGKTATKPEKGWNSVMAMPRMLRVDSSGFLRQEPPPEFEALRGEPKTAPAEISGDCLEIDAGFTPGRSGSVGLRVRTSRDGKSGLPISYDGDRFSVGSASIPVGRRQKVRMRVFLDKRVVEAYLDEGTAAIFTTVTAAPEDVAVEAQAAAPGARLDSFKAWPLKPARFGMEGFR